MAVAPLPQPIDLDQLRELAHELRRGVRAGEPESLRVAGHTALHVAVERDDLLLARRLLALGAKRELRDARFDGTPLDWARHLRRPGLEALLCE